MQQQQRQLQRRQTTYIYNITAIIQQCIHTLYTRYIRSHGAWAHNVREKTLVNALHTTYTTQHNDAMPSRMRFNESISFTSKIGHHYFLEVRARARHTQERIHNGAQTQYMCQLGRRTRSRWRIHTEWVFFLGDAHRRLCLSVRFRTVRPKRRLDRWKILQENLFVYVGIRVRDVISRMRE